MAELIPSYGSCDFSTGGEKRFAQRLKSHLEDDYLCWYDVPVGRVRQRYPDFVILHPGRGLLLLEVKDWKLDTIHEITPYKATLKVNNRLVEKASPLAQVRECSHTLVNALQRDPQLLQSDGPYAGNLVCPYGVGVVLTNITRKQFDDHRLGDVLPEHLVICQDEMVESVDVEAFQKRLWDMFSVYFDHKLTLPQIDRIRWHLFPELRPAGPSQKALFDEEEPDVKIPDIVHIMDLQQEQLARSLGSGHRVIHGVAGSGKTLILGYRCEFLAQQLEKPILVLCFNVALAARLRDLISEKGIESKVQVRNFHEWCGQQLDTYHVKKPKFSATYTEELVQSMIKACADGHIPRAQYGAIMIDEGHDFEPEWLRLVTDAIDPDNDSLLLLYDDAQAIYSNKKELGFSLKSVGVNAQGRTTILRLNYRNTNQIIHFAHGFAKEYFLNDSTADTDTPLIQPEASGRQGPAPVVRTLESQQQEAEYICRSMISLHKCGMPWSDMCVLYRAKSQGELLHQVFAKHGVPTHWLSTTAAKRKLKVVDDRVRLMTMHSSKGLEFPFVAVTGAHRLPLPKCNEVAEAKLLYVAMTRATDKLLVTGCGGSGFMGRLVG